MKFNNSLTFENYLKECQELGFGAQGTVYLDKKQNLAIKVYHQYFDSYEDDYIWKKEDILKFNGYQNNTYIFPLDILSVNNCIIGEVSKYVKGKNLDKINPLTINIDEFIKAITKSLNDVKEISNQHIISYDTAYNTMYNGNSIHIIDTTEYTISNLSEEQIKEINQDNFNFTIMTFLVDSYFDEFIENNNILKEMYMLKNINILEFLRLYKLKLSEHTGSEIKELKEASKCLNKKRRVPKYIRSLH